jgi:hypothetical protein
VVASLSEFAQSDVSDLLDSGIVVLHGDYDAAKTASQAGDEMDLVNAPNETAIEAINAAIEALIGVPEDTVIGDLDAYFASLGGPHGGLTVRDALRKMLSMLTGPTTGAGTTTETFKKPDGSGPDVVVTNDGTNRVTTDLDP